MHLLAVGEELGEVARAREFQLPAVARHVAPRGINGLAVLPAAQASDRVELFHRESERIDHAVAAGAGNRLRLQRYSLTGRYSRVEVGGERRESLGRGQEGPPKNVTSKQYAAMDRG